MPQHEMQGELEHPLDKVAAAVQGVAGNVGLAVKDAHKGGVTLTQGFGVTTWPLRIEVMWSSGGGKTALSLHGKIGGFGPLQRNALQKKMNELVAATSAALTETAQKPVTTAAIDQARPAHSEAPSPQEVAGGSQSLAGELQKLHALHEAGALSEKDFEQSKRVLLNATASSDQAPVQPTQAQSPAAGQHEQVHPVQVAASGAPSPAGNDLESSRPPLRVDHGFGFDASGGNSMKALTSKEAKERKMAWIAVVVGLVLAIPIFFVMESMEESSAGAARCWTKDEIVEFVNPRNDLVRLDINPVSGMPDCRFRIVTTMDFQSYGIRTYRHTNTYRKEANGSNTIRVSTQR